jgi:hypothetical protein
MKDNSIMGVVSLAVVIILGIIGIGCGGYLGAFIAVIIGIFVQKAFSKRWPISWPKQ